MLANGPQVLAGPCLEVAARVACQGGPRVGSALDSRGPDGPPTAASRSGRPQTEAYEHPALGGFHCLLVTSPARAWAPLVLASALAEPSRCYRTFTVIHVTVNNAKLL